MNVIPCPFCGGAAAHGLWGDRRMAVRCFRCDAMGPSTDVVPEVCINIRPFIDQAVDAWNRPFRPLHPLPVLRGREMDSPSRALAPEDLQRLRRMYENLRGAPGVQQRRDRETLRRALMVLESAPASPRCGDGGMAWVREIFAPREVVKLEVPGSDLGGLQRIVIGFADGGAVECLGLNVAAAWQAVADEAERARR